MRIQLRACTLRPWRLEDAAAIVPHANNREIWLHLRDYFPHPYTLADAEGWLGAMAPENPPTALAIEVEGGPVGGIGAIPGRDVHRLTAEIGYWLGEDFWNRGIMTQAVGAFTDYLFAEFGLRRVFAVPYSNSPASCRTLEKNGFLLEGRLRQSVIKDGVILDQLMYARTL
jgi:ribosomal-protein-alanine N-acetyltransferase